MAKSYYGNIGGVCRKSTRRLSTRQLIWLLINIKIRRRFDIFGTNMDDVILQELEEEILLMCTMMMATCNTHNLFNPNELEESGQSVNPNVGVMNVFNHMREVSTLFKVLTNFEVPNFDEFASLVCPTICDNARSTTCESIMSGKPMKLTLEQHLLDFIMYLKHNNVISNEFFQ